MRPLYETQADLHNENIFKSKLESAFKVELKKAPISYKVDFFIFKNKELTGILEYKKRKYKWNDFDTQYMPLQKLIAMRSIVSSIGYGNMIYLIECDDGFRYSQDFSNLKIIWQGRSRDAEDQEPTLLIPIERFIPIRL